MQCVAITRKGTRCIRNAAINGCCMKHYKIVYLGGIRDPEYQKIHKSRYRPVWR